MLDDRQTLAIELLAEGVETRTDIAKMCGVQRSTLYTWMNNDSFVMELGNRVQRRKSLVEGIMDAKLEDMVNELELLIRTTENDMVKSRSITYWIDRGLGKPTTKLDIEAGIKEQPTGTDLLAEEFMEFDGDV